MKTKSITLAVSILFLMSAAAFAGVPDEISFMGRLVQSGQPVTTTTSITFQLYENATGGSSVWSQTLGVTPNSQGVYVAYLGTAMNPIPTSYDTLWLQVIVEGTTLQPRRRFTSVPYSRRSQGDVPIGTIMAWHKDLAGVPSLPDGWVECNGQTLSDAESPLNGQTIPSLNYANGRFLRGGTSSGAFQNATKVVGPWQYNRAFGAYFGGDGQDAGENVEDYDWSNTPRARYQHPVKDVSAGNTVPFSYRVRSTNMSVIWIMRVK